MDIKAKARTLTSLIA